MTGGSLTAPACCASVAGTFASGVSVVVRCSVCGMGAIGTTAVVNLEPNQCWMMLRSCEVGRIAMSTADHPDIFPVNFVVHHGSIVFRIAEDTRLAEAALGRLVAFEVDGYDIVSNEAWVSS